MTVYCVTYDLKAPGKDYKPVHDYLKTFNYCKDLESFWLIDSTKSAAQIRDDLRSRIDGNDKVFVARLHRKWGSINFGCGSWLNSSSRNW